MANIKYDFVCNVVVITGASTGIGRRIAELFIKANSVVYITSLSLVEIEKTIQEIRKKYPNNIIYGMVLDVNRTSTIKTVIGHAIRNHGAIDIWVNNAGYLKQEPFKDISIKEYHKHIDINQTGVWNCCKAILPVMKRQGSGRVINVSSIGGQIGGSLAPHYSMAKAAIISLTKSLARIYSPLGNEYGLTVNAVAPNLVSTNMTKEIIENLDEETIREKIPTGHIANTKDIANAVAFLASYEARQFTGQVLNPNGGSYMP